MMGRALSLNKQPNISREGGVWAGFAIMYDTLISKLSCPIFVCVSPLMHVITAQFVR